MSRFTIPFPMPTNLTTWPMANSVIATAEEKEEEEAGKEQTVNKEREVGKEHSVNKTREGAAASAKKEFQPNVNSLLKALASGDACLKGGKVMSVSFSLRPCFQRRVKFQTVYDSVLKHPDNSTKHN